MTKDEKAVRQILADLANVFYDNNGRKLTVQYVGLEPFMKRLQPYLRINVPTDGASK